MSSTLNDGKKTDRRCQSWLADYVKWVSPVSDAPPEYIFWSGLFCISAAIRRKVFLPKEVIGGWKLYGHQYLMFIGPPGMRKTSTMDNYASYLLRGLEEANPGVYISANEFSKESLLTEIKGRSEHSVVCLLGEFGDVMQKNNTAQMYDFLNSMYDAKDVMKILTFKRGEEILLEPCLNMFAATTPNWIAENMSEEALLGGFGSRMLVIYADKLGEGNLINRKKLKELDLDRKKLEEDLLHDLIHIASLEGTFDLTDEVEEFANEWTKEHNKKIPPSPKLGGYFKRKPMHALKLSMLLTLTETDELIVTQENFQWALNLLDSLEPSMIRAFAGVGKNEHALDLENVVEFVRKHGRVSSAEMVSAFKQVGLIGKIAEIIKTAVAMGEIHQHGSGENIFWTPA